jgi:threonyl-tRNA synthetase
VSVRRRSGEETRGVSLETFTEDLAAEVEARRVEPSL